MNLEQLCINTIRMLSVDMVQKANSGHPGMPMGAAPMAYVLWTKFLKHNPTNPLWPDRDRFVLSAGHGSALLYSLLYLTGYDLSLDDLKNFRQLGSKTAGHPERLASSGIECTTGPLGQGFATGVGLAIAERHLASRFNRPDCDIVNHYTYAIVGDGDLMEGVSSEAASLAGHLKLGKLIYLYDDNNISLAGDTILTFTEDVRKRFDACGWHTQEVKDGNDIKAISEAIINAQNETSRPSLISIKTNIGYGSPNKQDTFEVHGSPLGKEEIILTKKNLGWPVEPDFFVPDEALSEFRKANDKGQKLEDEWKEKIKTCKAKYPELIDEWENNSNINFPSGWNSELPIFETDPKGIATRAASGKVLNAIAKQTSYLIGGSADLNPSTNTALSGKGNFQAPGTGNDSVQGAVSGGWGYEGANIAFGVREHAMGSIANGIAIHKGLLPFASTFLVFSDYMRPAVRLSALMKLYVIYIFTHDSIALGEDGPTHQPVEHISSLRLIPGLTVIRPADANEVTEAWKAAVERKDKPIALILTRQKVPVIDREKYASQEGLKNGAYILADSLKGYPELILMATGSEVHIALEAYEKLSAEGIGVRVVSMPSWEIFEEQSEEYKNKILPPAVKKRISIEAGATLGWYKYVGSDGITVGIDHFGASAPGDILLKKFGFTSENIIDKARMLLRKKN